MTSKINWDKVFSFASWLIVLALLYGVANLIFLPPTGHGPIAGLVGIHPAQVFYIALYLCEGLALGYSKWKKKDKMRRNVLLVIYLTGFFTSILGFVIGGVSSKLVGNLVIALAAAFCWLHWKFRTEYIYYEYLTGFDEKEKGS
jgi:hypothetical protein